MLIIIIIIIIGSGVQRRWACFAFNAPTTNNVSLPRGAAAETETQSHGCPKLFGSRCWPPDSLCFSIVYLRPDPNPNPKTNPKRNPTQMPPPICALIFLSYRRICYDYWSLNTNLSLSKTSPSFSPSSSFGFDYSQASVLEQHAPMINYSVANSTHLQHASCQLTRPARDNVNGFTIIYVWGSVWESQLWRVAKTFNSTRGVIQVDHPVCAYGLILVWVSAWIHISIFIHFPCINSFIQISHVPQIKMRIDDWG